MAKSLKFDISLTTGTIERNVKRCVNGLQTTWKKFGQNMKKSNSFLDMANSVTMLGKNGFTSIMRLVNPYAAVVQATVTAIIAVKALCKQYEALEKASLKASNAFKTGGKMGSGGFAKYSKIAESMAGNGNITQEQAIGAIGNARSSAHSLDTKTFDEMISVSKDANAFLGGDYASTLSKIAGLLDNTSVSYETLKDAGLEFTIGEIQNLDALKRVGRQAEANAVILKKMKEVYKGAEEAQNQTLSGMFQNFGNLLNDIMADVGKLLAPILKAVMAIVNPIFGLAKALTGLFAPVADVLDIIAGSLYALLSGFIGPIINAVKEVGDAISGIWKDFKGNTLLGESVKIFGAIGNCLGFICSIGTRILATIIKIIGAGLKPIFFIIGVIKNIITSIFKGFSGSGVFDKWKNIFNKIFSLFDKLSQIIGGIWDGFKDSSVMNFLYKIYEVIGGLIGSAIGVVFDAISSGIDGLNWVLDKLAEWGNWAKGLVGLGSGKTDKTGVKENSAYRDPRIRFNASIESSGSMSQRIQKAVMERYSPQAKMVDYLKKIDEQVGGISATKEEETKLQVEHLRRITTIEEFIENCVGKLSFGFGE